MLSKLKDKQFLEHNLQLIKQGRLVEETLNTEGWKEIISPLIDKMIIDVVGGKENGQWITGSFGDKRLGEIKSNNLLWYRQALIELHNHIMSYVTAAENAKKMIKDSEENEELLKKSPMTTGSYSKGAIGQEWSSYVGFNADEDGGTNG